MLLRLQQYDLQVTYKKGTELYVADSLSRAYQEVDPNDTLEEELEIHVVLPMTPLEVERTTGGDTERSSFTTVEASHR